MGGTISLSWNSSLHSDNVSFPKLSSCPSDGPVIVLTVPELTAFPSIFKQTSLGLLLLFITKT